MLPFGNTPTRPFVPGAAGQAFFSRLLLPVHEISGPGTLTRRQFGIEAAPLVQVPAVPQAWKGTIAGQFVSQPLVDPNGGGTATGG